MTGASDTPAPMGEDDLVARLVVLGTTADSTRPASYWKEIARDAEDIARTAVRRIATLEASLREAEATIGALRELTDEFSRVNELRWGDDDKEPPSWEEVRVNVPGFEDKDLEYWRSYMEGMIIEAAKDVVHASRTRAILREAQQ